MSYLYEQHYRVLIEAPGLDAAWRVDRAVRKALEEIDGIEIVAASPPPVNLWPGSAAEQAAREEIDLRRRR